MNWERAISYCESLTLGRFDDWRLPNIKELRSIVDTSRQDPAIDPRYFNDTNLSEFWSSTHYTHYANSACTIDFGHIGYDGYSGKSNTNYVRAVRAGIINEEAIYENWGYGLYFVFGVESDYDAGIPTYHPENYGYDLLGVGIGSETFSGGYDTYILVSYKENNPAIDFVSDEKGNAFDTKGTGNTSLGSNSLESLNNNCSSLGGSSSSGGFIVLKSRSGITDSITVHVCENSQNTTYQPIAELPLEPITKAPQGDAEIIHSPVIHSNNNIILNYPAYNAPADLYMALLTPSGKLLFLNSNDRLTTDFSPYVIGAQSAIKNIIEIENDPLYHELYGNCGLFWLVAPSNGGNLLASIENEAYELGYYNVTTDIPAVFGNVSLPQTSKYNHSTLSLTTPESDEIQIDPATGSFSKRESEDDDVVDFLILSDDEDNPVFLSIDSGSKNTEINARYNRCRSCHD